MAKEPLHAPIHEPVHQALDWNSMTDEQVMSMIEQQESGSQFDIPYGLEPDGMSYQWKRATVLERPDHANLALLEQRGWRPVPQRRHAGRWMPAQTEGPILVEGLMLMEIPTRVLEIKEQRQEKQAKDQRNSLEDRMLYTPPGSAPRDAHPRTRPVLRSERIPVTFDVQA